ncbi:hypothetical protein [Cobetia sp. L2A1]|uniref:hypothetical protein n=1 Tax=Cobetia sp. L2A1 TaxID=2686360 RepID=UPI00131CAF66|nr:hypothetical protein [Cobetia sp. L2A1]
MGMCKLCHQESCLQESHILPNSIAKRIKSHGQTIVIYENKEPAFENSNFNYIEPMLCRKCEQILCKYESYGTNVTRNRKVVKRKGKEFVVFSVDFKRYYLYLISILWRAGITNHAQFTIVKMGESLLELMRNCIFNNKLIWNRDGLEDIISISIVKVNNEYEHLSDDALRKIVITPRLDEEKKKLVIIT